MTDSIGCATLTFVGTWELGATPVPTVTIDAVRSMSGSDNSIECRFDMAGVQRWDTSLVLFVIEVIDAFKDSGVNVCEDSLPETIRKLIALSRAVPPGVGRPRTPAPGLLTRVGNAGLRGSADLYFVCEFIGNTARSTLRVLSGRGTLRWRDFWVLVQDCGIQALPIVGLISLLIGLILAFVGAVQLKLFGAEIYVADLVGLAMVREMGALMTAIIMTGRSGAAFAAHLGSMKVSEEIEALTTFGFDTFDMLVTPRMLALFLMMPLLCVYSDVIGILGGLIIGTTMLDLPLRQYLIETQEALNLTQILIGVVKATVFGILIAGAGCLQGLRCGNNAAAVGQATTAAVVTGIVLIVVADSFFAVLLEILGL
ncbi:MAG: phospholipid/cholesterol/gamma-HCH transport system permease protein [Verrucomicrobiales bacterium]